MSKTKKIIMAFTLGILFLIIFNGEVNAANASISCDSSVTVGTPITISVSGSAVQWNLELKVNGTTIASNSELENYEANKTINFSGTYTPNKEGTLNITLTGTATEASDGSTVRSFSGKEITVKAKETTPPTSNSSTNENSSSNNSNSSLTGTSNNSPEKKSKLTSVTVDGTTYNNGDKIVVENDKSTVKILGVGESLYYIKVNGESSGVNVKLNEGTNSIVVYDNNGGEIKLSISRKAKEEETKPNVIEKNEEDEKDKKAEEELVLNTIEVEGFNLDPKFSPDIYSYTINIDTESTSPSKLEIKTTSNQEDATIKIDGAEELVQGENVINIIVTSKDGSQIKTYQILVNKIITSSEKIDNTEKIETPSQENNEFIDKNKILITVGCIGVLIVIVLTIVIVKKTRLKEDDETGNLYNYDLHINEENNKKNAEKSNDKQNESKNIEVSKKEKKKRKSKGKHA